MRKATKIIVGVAFAGLVAAGGSAFTASNTLPTGGVAGYGQSVVTGATVTGITDNPLSTDHSKLSSVTFSTTTNVTANTVSMTLKNGATVVGSPYSCTVSGTATPWTITCLTADNPSLAAFDTTGLTVV